MTMDIDKKEVRNLFPSAQRLAAMIDAKLVTRDHLVPWADELIAAIDSPPDWLIAISMSKSLVEALAATHNYWRACDRSFGWDDTDEFVACLFLRYQRGELSWATFLNESGIKSDSSSGRVDCEYFYAMLTELEEGEFAYECENRQRQSFEEAYSNVIASVERTYLPFLRCFRNAIRRRQG